MNDRLFWRKLDFRIYFGTEYQLSEFENGNNPFYLNVFSSTDLLKGNCDGAVFESNIKCMQGNRGYHFIGGATFKCMIWLLIDAN